MCLCFDILHVPDETVSIEKMNAHGYRDNISDVVNYYREFFVGFKFYLTLCQWEQIALS